MGLSGLIFFILSLLAGAALGGGFFYYRQNTLRKSEDSSREVSVLLERIEKVFKVVMAEGYFTEIYDYEDNKSFWQVFKDKKKALVISKAKVLVGYDFGKMKFRIDQNSRKLVIEYFPEPEVLSIDTDYKFYDIEQGWLNKFQTEDYTQILNEAKIAMTEKALLSDLPRIANNQLQFMMIQLAAGMNWKIGLQLSESNQKMLDSFSEYTDTVAKVKSLSIETPDSDKPGPPHPQST